MIVRPLPGFPRVPRGGRTWRARWGSLAARRTPYLSPARAGTACAPYT